VYGQVPAGEDVRLTQLVPEDGGPPPSLRGRRVKVTVYWRYKEHLGTGPQSAEAVFDVLQ
jgi:hypothetical protein